MMEHIYGGQGKRSGRALPLTVSYAVSEELASSAESRRNVHMKQLLIIVPQLRQLHMSDLTFPTGDIRCGLHSKTKSILLECFRTRIGD